MTNNTLEVDCNPEIQDAFENIMRNVFDYDEQRFKKDQDGVYLWQDTAISFQIWLIAYALGKRVEADK